MNANDSTTTDLIDAITSGLLGNINKVKTYEDEFDPPLTNINDTSMTVVPCKLVEDSDKQNLDPSRLTPLKITGTVGRSDANAIIDDSAEEWMEFYKSHEKLLSEPIMTIEDIVRARQQLRLHPISTSLDVKFVDAYNELKLHFRDKHRWTFLCVEGQHRMQSCVNAVTLSYGPSYQHDLQPGSLSIKHLRSIYLNPDKDNTDYDNSGKRKKIENNINFLKEYFGNKDVMEYLPIFSTVVRVETAFPLTGSLLQDFHTVMYNKSLDNRTTKENASFNTFSMSMAKRLQDLATRVEPPRDVTAIGVDRCLLYTIPGVDIKTDMLTNYSELAKNDAVMVAYREYCFDPSFDLMSAFRVTVCGVYGTEQRRQGIRKGGYEFYETDSAIHPPYKYNYDNMVASGAWNGKSNATNFFPATTIGDSGKRLIQCLTPSTINSDDKPWQ